MLAEGDNTALIIGLIILAPLIIWIIGWIYALTRGTARFVRHQTTKDPEVRARIERDIYRGMQERGYAGPQPERRYQTWGQQQGEGDPALLHETGREFDISPTVRRTQTVEPPMLIWPTVEPSDSHFPYTGEHHSLGMVRRDGSNRYVIEDSDGSVVQDFVYASDGWSAAWKRFTQLEQRWKPADLESRISAPTTVDATTGYSTDTSDARMTTDSRRELVERTNGSDDVTQVRKITYQLGQSVETPDGNIVTVLDALDDATWRSSDGGKVEPAEGAKFIRLRTSYLANTGIDDVGDV
jgi:hypothetical protein